MINSSNPYNQHASITSIQCDKILDLAEWHVDDDGRIPHDIPINFTLFHDLWAGRINTPFSHELCVSYGCNDSKHTL